MIKSQTDTPHIFLHASHLSSSKPSQEIELSDIAPGLKLQFSIATNGGKRTSDVKLMAGDKPIEPIEPVETLSGPKGKGYFLLFATNNSLINVHVDEKSSSYVSFRAAHIKGDHTQANINDLRAHLVPHHL